MLSTLKNKNFSIQDSKMNMMSIPDKYRGSESPAATSDLLDISLTADKLRGAFKPIYDENQNLTKNSR